ncbi:MAG: acetyl-CoA carboxylase biotin carboxyl carrier protein [Oscillospiraceae bacterium]|nr:acetyl-CoA carboxylase biotin carboxyl carrier protein [Oscillospiraceae bacterium]
MSEMDIRKYAQLMGEYGLTGLEFRSAGDTIRLERNVVSAPVLTSAPAAAPAAPVAENTDIVSVTSPMVGVFYRAPAENAEPYVKVGDSVKAGTVLCLVEAMKMMNEITAECDGTIAEICVQNGQVVDFGRELFKIAR